MSDRTPPPDVIRMEDFSIEALARGKHIGESATSETLPAVDVFAGGEVELLLAFVVHQRRTAVA